MIVDPDFLEHWKTQILADLLDGDELAPLYLIRIWAHCQNRREWVFEGLSMVAIKAICRYKGDTKKLFSALTESGFISFEDGTLTVVGWDEYNASLIANWHNGKKGGRPKKQKTTEPKPNPSKTHGLPIENPSRTDKIGLDKIGLDNKEKVKKRNLPDKSKSKASSIEEVIQFCQSIDLPASDGTYMWNHWQGNGWTNADKAIKDWQATVRSWKAAGYLPSQKKPTARHDQGRQSFNPADSQKFKMVS